MKLEQTALVSATGTAAKRSNNPVFTGKMNACAILDKFERQENIGKGRELKVNANKEVEGLLNVFREFLGKETPEGLDEACGEIRRKTKTIAYTADDIRIFSMALAKFQYENEFYERAGIFLSALINSSREKDFIIEAGNLSVGMVFIGYENTKNVTVIGNVGDYAGFYMDGGSLMVEGNAEMEIGRNMKRGRITVKGDVGRNPGRYMKKGRIDIDGSARDFYEFSMDGGRLTVNGCIGVGFADNTVGGNIYQKKRQLVRNGEKIAEPKNK